MLKDDNWFFGIYSRPGELEVFCDSLKLYDIRQQIDGRGIRNQDSP